MEQVSSGNHTDRNDLLLAWTSDSPVDTNYEVVAPENVAFKYRVAGPFARTCAFTVDMILLGAYLGVSCNGVSFLLSTLNEHSLLSDRLHEQLLVAFLVLNVMLSFWFGTALFEAFWHGRTPGKAVFRLRVLSLSGRPIGIGQALLRNVLRFADCFIGPFGVVVMGMNERMARLGDLAAGTVVVFEGRKKRIGKDSNTATPLVQTLCSKIPEDFIFTSELRDALALYVSRRNDMTPARRYEVALSFADLLAKKAGFSYRVEPDAFLCALYRFSLGAERRAY